MHMPSGHTLFTTLIVMAGLSGCAAPQYQTAYRYEPPADAQGLACVQACEQSKQTCQAGCQTRHQACQKDIEPLVEDGYTQVLKLYEQELRDYSLELQAYRTRIWMSWPYDPWPYYPGYYSPWPGPYYPLPNPVPTMPTRGDVKAALEKEKCQADCGCLPSFDACFVGCGGKRIPQTVCTGNCPKQN